MKDYKQQVPIPKRVQPRMGLTAEYMMSIRRSIDTLARRGNTDRGSSSPDTLPPFTPRLVIETGPTYSVVVFPGMVCDIIKTALTGEDSIKLTEPNNIYDVDGFLNKFAISEDEAVFVKVPEDENGKADYDNIEIVIDDKDKESTNYITVEQDGEYYYKLAEFVAHDTFPNVLWLKPFLAGSHIFRVSGLSIDTVIEDCNGDPYANPPTRGYQLLRHRFLSGVLAGVNEGDGAPSYHPSTVFVQVEPCS